MSTPMIKLMIIRFPGIENLSNGDNRIRYEFNTSPERDHRCNIHDSARYIYIYTYISVCCANLSRDTGASVASTYLERSRERLRTRNARVNCARRVKCFGILIYHLRSTATFHWIHESRCNYPARELLVNGRSRDKEIALHNFSVLLF